MWGRAIQTNRKIGQKEIYLKTTIYSKPYWNFKFLYNGRWTVFFDISPHFFLMLSTKALGLDESFLIYVIYRRVSSPLLNELLDRQVKNLRKIEKVLSVAPLVKQQRRRNFLSHIRAQSIRWFLWSCISCSLFNIHVLCIIFTQIVNC